MKYGRPLDSKNKNPRKKRRLNNDNKIKESKNGQRLQNINSSKIHFTEEVTFEELALEECTSKENKIIENSINFIIMEKSQNRKEIIFYNTLAYNVALVIIEEDENHEFKSTDEYRHRNDWLN